jgi:hypothetical protein
MTKGTKRERESHRRGHPTSCFVVAGPVPCEIIGRVLNTRAVERTVEPLGLHWPSGVAGRFDEQREKERGTMSAREGGRQLGTVRRCDARSGSGESNGVIVGATVREAVDGGEGEAVGSPVGDVVGGLVRVDEGLGVRPFESAGDNRYVCEVGLSNCEA